VIAASLTEKIARTLQQLRYTGNDGIFGFCVWFSFGLMKNKLNKSMFIKPTTAFEINIISKLHCNMSLGHDGFSAKVIDISLTLLV